MNTPGAVDARAGTAVSRLHTTGAGVGCNRMRLSAPGVALLKSTGDPAFRCYLESPQRRPLVGVLDRFARIQLGCLATTVKFCTVNWNPWIN